MSIIDNTFEFSDAQAVTGSIGAVTVSTVKPSAGSGNKNAWGTSISPQIGGLTWNVGVNTVVNASTIITASLVTKASSASMSSGSTTLASVVFPAAAAAGTKRAVVLPVGTECLAYLAVLYTVSGAKATTGAFNSWLGLDNEVID